MISWIDHPTQRQQENLLCISLAIYTLHTDIDGVLKAENILKQSDRNALIDACKCNFVSGSGDCIHTDIILRLQKLHKIIKNINYKCVQSVITVTLDYKKHT